MNKTLDQKLYGLDHLRALAIVLVFFFHYFILSGGEPKWLPNAAQLGWTGVDLFFVLSGFLPRALGLIRIPNGIDNEGLPKYLSPFGWFYEHICKKVPGIPENGSLVYAISMIIMYWAICYWLDKKKIYIKV